jgi:biopolymer transport protein ExbD
VIVVDQRVYSADALEKLLRESRARNAQLAAIIRCDRRARHADFVKVLNLCERTGVRQVAVATLQTDE